MQGHKLIRSCMMIFLFLLFSLLYGKILVVLYNLVRFFSYRCFDKIPFSAFEDDKDIFRHFVCRCSKNFDNSSYGNIFLPSLQEYRTGIPWQPLALISDRHPLATISINIGAGIPSIAICRGTFLWL